MRGWKTKAFVIALALCAPAIASAGWQDEATSYDQARLARIDEARAKGLDEAGDVAAEARGALNAPASGRSVAGAWRCRTIKLGGMARAVVYSWFHCRVKAFAGGLVFEKLNGSQRMAGRLYAEGDGYVYLGASWVKGEQPHRYSGNGASVGAGATPDDQIGRLVATSYGARLELPYPLQESTFDVIELRR
jgi:hypothetical protein